MTLYIWELHQPKDGAVEFGYPHGSEHRPLCTSLDLDEEIVCASCGALLRVRHSFPSKAKRLGVAYELDGELQESWIGDTPAMVCAECARAEGQDVEGIGAPELVTAASRLAALEGNVGRLVSALRELAEDMDRRSRYELDGDETVTE